MTFQRIPPTASIALRPGRSPSQFAPRPFAVSPDRRRGILQRTQVEELTDKDQEKWFVVQGNVVAKLTGVYMDKEPHKWEFRRQDDVLGNDRYVFLTSGRVVPLPHFGIVIEKQYEGEEENWFGELAKQSERGAFFARKQGSGKIKQIKYEQLLEIGEEISKNEVGVNDYDQTHLKANEGIWTDGIGPCIAIALTGTYKGNRVNVLHHSFVTHYDSKKYGQIGEDIAADIANTVEGTIQAPLSAVKNQEVYIVGGDKDSATKMEALLRALIIRKFNIVSVVDTTSEPSGKSSKALFISSDGEVSWSYQQK